LILWYSCSRLHWLQEHNRDCHFISFTVIRTHNWNC